MKQKRALISVINDLATDQRVDKTARVLMELGYEVMMVGRHKSDSMKMPERPYQTNRMRLLWEKGPIFYAEFNTRLFFFLLWQKCDLLVSNDLDTLLPNFLVHKLKNVPVVFDSHEYFTETPEVIHRPFVKNFWKRIEKSIVPRLNHCITVNESIAGLFKSEYNIDFQVVRNIPRKVEFRNLPGRKELGLPEDRKIVLMQGSGINIQRGAEELVETMQYLEGMLLLIVGGGDVLPELKSLVKQLDLDTKVQFVPKQTPEKLFAYTSLADLGVTLDKDTNINYRFSLPNKLFDYIHAGIPILASPLPEIRKIVEQYKVGSLIENHEPRHIAKKIEEMLSNPQQFTEWKENLRLAALELNWENEKKGLIEVFNSVNRKT
jgi:glycosyltransferase involved in cell wall biosynthesis